MRGSIVNLSELEFTVAVDPKVGSVRPISGSAKPEVKLDSRPKGSSENCACSRAWRRARAYLKFSMATNIKITKPMAANANCKSDKPKLVMICSTYT